MLSTGNHGELIIDGWLASSDENASPVRVWFRQRVTERVADAWATAT